MSKLTTAYFNLGGVRRLGVVVDHGFNAHTVWVKVMKGAKTYFTVKRHLVKHNVTINWGYVRNV